MANREIKKIGIVYSGGLARGAAQLSFAREIINRIGYERIAVISSSSIGALNAYATSVGNIDKMLSMYAELDHDSTFRFMHKIRNDLFSKIFRRVEGDKLMFPTYVTGTKIFNFDTHYFCLNNMSRADMKSAINVSMSFPIINGPLRFNHSLYIDGGATDNVPVYPMNYFDVDMIIILHCYPKYYPPEILYKLKPNTIIVDVDVTLGLDKAVTSFSLAKSDFIYMIEEGQKSGKIFTDFIFEDFDFDKVKERCLQYTRDHLHARHLKSGDGLMSLVDVLNALYRFKSDLYE